MRTIRLKFYPQLSTVRITRAPFLNIKIKNFLKVEVERRVYLEFEN